MSKHQIRMLFGEELPAYIEAEVALALIPDDPAGPEPSPAMVASVKAVGVLERVILADAGDTYRIINGYRRVRAARLAGLFEVPARVYRDLGDKTEAGLTVALNALRSPNPYAEYEAIARMRAAGLSEKAVAEATGMPAALVKRRLLLGRLGDELMAGLAAGKMTASVAEEAARLPREGQVECADYLAEHGVLHRKYVRQVIQRYERPDTSALAALLPGLGEPVSVAPTVDLDPASIIEGFLAGLNENGETFADDDLIARARAFVDLRRNREEAA